MDTLPKLYPNVADLLAIPPEHLVSVLLKFGLIAAQRQGGRFQIGFANDIATGEDTHAPHIPRYSPLDRRKIDRLLGETWHFIEREAFIMPDTGMNGTNGFKVFTAKGEVAAKNFDPDKYREAAAFQKKLLHPTIIAITLTSTPV